MYMHVKKALIEPNISFKIPRAPSCVKTHRHYAVSNGETPKMMF